MSDSPPERDVQWTTGGIQGAWRFVNRVWNEFDTQPNTTAEAPVDGDPAAVELVRATHRLVAAVTDSIEGFRFNSGVARLYEFLNTLRAAPAESASPGLLAARRQALSTLARLIAPFTPHLAESCWERLGEVGMVVDAPWPMFDPALAAVDERVLPVQINGKRRGEIRATAGALTADIEKIALADAGVQRHLEGLTVRKVIVVQDRIVNIVAA